VDYCDPELGVVPIVDEYSESPLIVSSERQQELSSNLIVVSSSAMVAPSASETTGVRVSSSSSVFSLSHLILATLTSIVVCYW
jgi:hypothetical protein